MNDLSRRTAREVLDDHLNIANDWVDAPFEQILDEDLRRNVSEDVVVLLNRGVFRGHDGVRELARMLAEELPGHRAFNYTHVSAEDRIALLEWTYEDDEACVRDGVDSYLIEDGKIIGWTIRYTVEAKQPSARDQVIAAAEERARAMAQQDKERLLQLLHEDFRWTSHVGEMFDRDEYVRRNVAGTITWRSQELTDTTVAIVGDAAVLWAVVTDVVESDGHTQTFRMPVTQTWVRDSDVWRCLAGHAGPRRP